LGELRFAKRRDDWLLGRWAAKSVLASELDLEDLSRVEVLADDDGAPCAYTGGRRTDLCVSISHSGGTGLCAVARNSAALGCDLERMVPRSAEMVRDFFTIEERQWLRSYSPVRRIMLDNLVWTAKEATLKLLRTGLRRDTRDVLVQNTIGNEARGELGMWQPLCTHLVPEQRAFSGWWCARRGCVLTVLGQPAPGPPVERFRC